MSVRLRRRLLLDIEVHAFAFTVCFLHALFTCFTVKVSMHGQAECNQSREL